MNITTTTFEVWNENEGYTVIKDYELERMAYTVSVRFSDGRTAPDDVRKLARLILYDLADEQCTAKGILRERAFRSLRPILCSEEIQDDE